MRKGVGAIFLLLALAACGGGGGDGGGGADNLTLSTNTLSFSAADQNAPVPLSQVVTATVTGVSSGPLFIRVVVTGPAVSSVTNVGVISSTQGQATVNPALPSALGAGTHTSVITVSVCTTDPNCSGAQIPGSPKTINVTYTVGAIPAPPTALAPSLATAGVAGDLIIRGSGFVEGTVVLLNGTPVTVTSRLSSTEFRVSHAALPAGSYPVDLRLADLSIVPLGLSLTVVDPPAYGTTFLNYPSAPQQVRGLAYDPVRKALLVGLDHANDANSELLRYAFTSTWQPPGSLTIPALRDVALSLDGSRALVVAEQAMVEVDPSTLSVTKSVPRPTDASNANEYLKGIALANDGNAVITTGTGNGITGHSRLFLYSTAASTLSVPQVANSNFNLFYYAVAGAPANGAFVNILQGGLSPAQLVHRYNASTRTLSATSFPLSHGKPGLHENYNVPAFDRAGTRMAVPEQTGTGVLMFDMGFVRYGALPGTTAAYAISPDAQRAYAMTVDSGACNVRAFNLGSATAGTFTVLPELTTAVLPITITCPSNGSAFNLRKMIVTPADDTAFIAGELGIAVLKLR
jgi:hypothetical protein